MQHKTVQVHDHGYVKLIDVMGTDGDIVDAARISYDRKGRTQDRALIRYLFRHRHTSPFEMCEMKFELKMPIFVARQWVRHRTASMNEVSARYTELPNEMFVPESFAVQSTNNKQGRGDAYSEQENSHLRNVMRSNNRSSYEQYEANLRVGMAREQAREVLNFNVYTKFVWKLDLHNLLHFLKLRTDAHAQQEIRDYADVIEDMVMECFPYAWEAWNDYSKEAYTLSRMEIDVLRKLRGRLTLETINNVLDFEVTDGNLTEREASEFLEMLYGKEPV